MPAEGMLGGYTITGERVGTDEHPLVRKHLPIDTDVVTAVLEPGVLLKEVEVKAPKTKAIPSSSTSMRRGSRQTPSPPAPWSMTVSTLKATPALIASSTAASGRGC